MSRRAAREHWSREGGRVNYDDDSKWSLSRRTHVKFQPPATPVSHSAWSAAVRNSLILIVHLTARSSDRCRIEIEQRAELNFFERLSARRRRRGGRSLFHSFFFVAGLTSNLIYRNGCLLFHGRIGSRLAPAFS